MLGPTEHTGARYSPGAGLDGEIGTAPSHAGDAHDPPFAAGTMETPPARSFGVMHTDLYGDVHLPGGIGHMDVTGESSMPGFGDYLMPGVVGDPEMPPARYAGNIHAGLWAGQMLTGVKRYVPFIGEIPIGPARSCGDIYATASVWHAGDVHTPLAIGNMYAGLWAGEMLTGVARRLGDMPTT